jgi:benzoyl-CoA reductase/2-hydroxyglutaryl-CoA dehydratase subunit BcrC/BadD/HgdB
MKMFEKFQEVYEKRHDYARDWKKRTGGEVMGCFCSYCPEEIIYAADILPVRMLGYVPGRSLEDELPLATFKEEGLPVV